jgi:hypothetical protein
VSHGDLEDLLSLLTGLDHLALIVGSVGFGPRL